MATDELIADADAKAVIAAQVSRTEIAPEIAQRIQERSERIRERLLREFGRLDIAVPAIRELRDE